MLADIIDGRAHAALLLSKAEAFLKTLQGVPGLVVVRVGDDPASEIYVNTKKRRAEALGIKSEILHLPTETSQEELLQSIDTLNHRSDIHGILVQLPLPTHLNPTLTINAITPEKDIDGLHPLNMGRLLVGDPYIVPCTPQGCLALLRYYLGDITGRKAVVLGRSRIVGMPLAVLLSQANCTVTILHSHSQNVPHECKEADILIAAAGRPHLVQGDWIKPGATVLDVGISRHTEPHGKTSLVGDVDYDRALYVAGAITPVPGGIGPMTVAYLLINTVKVFCAQTNQTFEASHL